MSPKSLVFLLVVGICVTQMASAHREARAVANLMAMAKNRLHGLVDKAKDAAKSTMETVENYITKIENQVLNAGTDALQRSGIQIDLVEVAGLVKNNVRICATDEQVKANAKAILNDVASCVVKDIKTLKSLKNDMQKLWKTAQNLPAAIQDVSYQCSAHADSEDAVKEAPLQLTSDEADDLAAATNELLQSASHHLSKRALWGMNRISRCINSVFSLGAKDLDALPGEMITVATRAFQLTSSIQGGIPACVTKKLAENSAAVTQLGLELGACVATGVSGDDDLERVLQNNPALGNLKGLAGAAEKLNELKDSEALKAANSVAKFLG